MPVLSFHTLVRSAAFMLALAILPATAQTPPPTDEAALRRTLEQLRGQRKGPEAPLVDDLRHIASDPVLTRTTLATGKRVSSLCANCHGPGGNSPFPETPNLAGQNPAYLLEQSRKFAHGARRHEFMQGLISAMTNEEIAAVAFYYAAQPVKPGPSAADAKLLAAGQSYYMRVCLRCHGADGQGNAQIARLAGQPTAYLQKTLKRYRNGSGERLDPIMASNTRLMSDGDIRAVAAYLSSMP